MTHSRKSLFRVLAATSTTLLVSVACLLTLTPAASARATITPDKAHGGSTETFAIRLSNERSVPSTRLELAFPKDVVIPEVKVEELAGWDAKITMRPLDPPVTIGGQEFDEAVASIVWTGGEVRPKWFEQFLVTAGPLPPKGRLVLTAAQGYQDGTVDRWSAPALPDEPGAPTISLVPKADHSPTDAGPADSTAEDVVIEDLAIDEQPEEQTDLTPWFLLAGGLLLAGAAGFIGYRRLAPEKRAALLRRVQTVIEKLPKRVGRR